MIRYALYARKSKEDKTGIVKSIKDQVDVWTELAASQGLHIAQVFEENKSAKQPGKRPIYLEMMARVRGGEFQGLLVWHVNRLARNMEEAGALAQMFIDGTISEIRTPHSVYRTGDNILPLLLEQGTSAQYSLDLSEAVKRGMRSAGASGGWPHQAKLGYLNARDPMNAKRGIIITDPERFELTRKGFDLMLTGNFTVKQVIDKMNSWGLRTRPTPTRPGQKLSYALGYDMFANPFYAGFTVLQGVTRKGLHEPMITLREHNQMQTIFNDRRRVMSHRHDFPFTGIARCGLCGMQVTAEQHVRVGKTHIYYRCSDPYGGCTKKGIPEATLQAQIIDLLDDITVDPELIEQAQKNFARWTGKASNDVQSIHIQQRERLVDIDVLRSKLLDMALSGNYMSDDLFKTKDAELLQERNALAMEIASYTDETEHIRAKAKGILDFMQHARQAFLLGDSETKRGIAKALGEYVLCGREVTITLNPVLREMARFLHETSSEFEFEKSGETGSDSVKMRDSADFSRVGRAKTSEFEILPNLLTGLHLVTFELPKTYKMAL
jgi:site-specific DNA recombinase